MGDKLINEIEQILKLEFNVTLQEATVSTLHYALGKAVISNSYEKWTASETAHSQNKRAFYFSAEFLMGRAVFNNLYCLGILEEVKAALASKGVDLNTLEDIGDDALGNGGLGRLAACFLDSAATQNIPLNGYGIRYKYGLFKQYFKDGFQKEEPDDWQRFGDPWSVRRDNEKVVVEFANEKVYAVPYDMPIFGYQTDNVNTLRLWQSEPLEEFDFDLFNEQAYDKAVKAKNSAQNISMILYPNDDTNDGKRLRLKQQYFFCSASLQDIIQKHKAVHGSDFSSFPKNYAIQLNDTHPVVSIAELIRLLVDKEGLTFEEAFKIGQQTFSYTNHTIMAEALEKWYTHLFKSVLPRIYDIILEIDKRLCADLKAMGVTREKMVPYRIVYLRLIHMARLAVYATHATNGVAQIHSEIIKDSVLKDWYKIYPERFQNKTNGITQRRWLGLCNKELADYVTTLGCGDFGRDLTVLKKLEEYADNQDVLKKLAEIKHNNKVILSDYIQKNEGMRINPDFIFDIQIKRLHEYKRQLLNAFSIVDIYYSMKEGKLDDFTPTAFIFGAKSAPGYFRAKGIIKYINEIAKLVNNDPDVNQKLAVIFVSDYRVSYAEKLVPAADVSEQISTAGTEASGTGNMKLMLNGAVTLGTLDGANVEIVEQAGEQNNYIFGAKVDEITALKDTYDPNQLYTENPRIKRVVDTLIDGTFDDGETGMFKELYTSLLEGATWHDPDNYFLLYDFEAYVEAKLQVNADYTDRMEFSKKCLMNIANSGTFSSDRTVKQYATEIWDV